MMYGRFINQNDIDDNKKVVVISEKEYFRFNKLKCKVKLLNSKNELVCRGTISGMIKPRDNA